MSIRASRALKALLFGVIVLFNPRILAPTARASEESFSFKRFGTVRIYASARAPKFVVLFVSGDNGWNKTSVDLARSLLDKEVLVVGVDGRTYLQEIERSAEPCGNPAADLLDLGRAVQKRKGLPEDMALILAGYQSGATLVYAALAEASSGVFLGGISLGFCPSLKLVKPLCRGRGLARAEGAKGRVPSVLPCPALETPWIVLQGGRDRVCSYDSLANFVGGMRTAQLIQVPGADHSFAQEKDWTRHFKMAFDALTLLKPSPNQAVAENLAGLPLVETPATQGESDFLAIDITGDSGFGVTDRGIAQGLAKRGIPTAALNSLKYFWVKKTPDGAGRDLERILRHYLSVWKKSQVVAVGYSLGAEVLPFMINRLPDELRTKVKLVALLGPSRSVNFEFHLSEWLVTKTRADDLPVLPEIERLGDVVLLCFYGEKDKAAICKRITHAGVKCIPLGSGHRVGRYFEPILEAIFREIDEMAVR